jgi:hypothetical protein
VFSSGRPSLVPLETSMRVWIYHCIPPSSETWLCCAAELLLILTTHVRSIGTTGVTSAPVLARVVLVSL